MESSPTYFRRLLQSSASTIFPGARGTPGSDNAGSYKLLVEEVQKIVKDRQQGEKLAQALDTSESDVLGDFDLTAFADHFQLDAVSRVALALPCRAVSKADLRSQAESLFLSSYQAFLARVANPPTTDVDHDLTPQVLASIVEYLIQDPPRNLNEEQRENLFYAIRVRYNNRMLTRIPPAVDSAMMLEELLGSPQDSRLVKRVQAAGPAVTSSLDICEKALKEAEVREFSYTQVANTLLFMTLAQNGDTYNPTVFVEAVRKHRAGARIDWLDVVQGFDKEHLRVTKKQFLTLYHALLPLTRVYDGFDIQTLWGGQWNYADTQLSFVVAFLSTTPEELDVTQIPRLKQAFDLSAFADASDNIQSFAETAIKHPLVSMEATHALFTMIFRSQETYNAAQQLGIPNTVINQNMTVFVCAASAVPKPWAPLQEQALKQLFYPFLTRRHENYDFVMHALWQHDKTWVAHRMVEFYNQEPMIVTLICDHAIEHGWLDQLLTISSNFAVDLASYAHSKGHCNLDDFAQLHVVGMGLQPFARAIVDFLRSKMEDEGLVQREHLSPTMVPLAVKTVYALLALIQEPLPEDHFSSLYRSALQFYPRLFNYGGDEQRDLIIDSNGKHGNQLAEEATKEMEERYKQMYGGTTNPENLVTELNRLKESNDPGDQELFAAMLSGLFEEYNCFGEYPNEALATTAVLFGGLISYQVLSGHAEQTAIYMIFEAISEYGPEDSMYRFGLQALIHVLPRLKEWPHLAERILHTPSLRGTAAIEAAENALKELQQEHAEVNGDGVNGIANGVLDDDFSESLSPAFTAIQIDPPLPEDLFEEPNEDISDKVTFVLNNVSRRNFDEKFKEIEPALEEKCHQWFAHYLVEELAKFQANNQGLYLQLLENFNRKLLWTEVLRETYISCQKMLNAQSTMDNQHERIHLKNLAGWLGSITLARNLPILHRNLSFKDLLLEAHENGRLLVAIPFACKTLVHAAHSKIFRPPNPWIVELLGLLSELYHCMELKLNMKFEIEMLCREFSMDIKNIEPLDIIRSRPAVQDQIMPPNYIPDADAFGEMALMGLSKRGPNERFSPQAVIAAVPDLGNMLQIPQAVGNITSQQMRNIFVNAAQQAIYEIIAPVVERSVTIASISTAELIQKDFVTEGDENKVRDSAHTMVKALSGSLALVTCKEPLRMSITNNIRILAARSLPEQLPEGQILMFVNDNIDTVCRLVEQAAEDHSLAEIDLQLQQAFDDRRQHNEQRPNEPFAQAQVSRWATLIPDPYSQDRHGLNRQQLTLYEEFGRQARIPAATHGAQSSQDGQRPLPDVLGEGYLPSLPTPAEAPALPRNPQVGRMQAMAGHGPPQVNGFVDPASTTQRIIDLMSDLLQASQEATEERVSEIGEGATIRRVYGTLLGVLETAPRLEASVLQCAQNCLAIIYGDHRRLEVEVFVRLLTQLCRMSPPTFRAITMMIATAEDDRQLNVNATVALHGEGLIDVQQIDTVIAKALKRKSAAALGYFRDIIDEMLLNEHAVALRTDFILSYEALASWLREDSQNALGREIMSKLQAPSSQVNGMPSPESDTTKVDQQEYTFEEWIKIQRKELPSRAGLAFVSQLHEKGVLANEEDATAFIRACIEYSCNSFDRISSNPYGTPDQAYIAVDALAKLVALLVLYQSPASEAFPVNKAKSLEAIIRLVILVMNDHHNRRERWNGRLYFRFFSSLLCEINSNRELITPDQEQEIYKVLALALLILQPRFFPGFIYPWLALLSHRLFVPAFLAPAGRTNGGWNAFTKLLTVLFSNLGDLLSLPDSPPVAQDFYRGVLRFFTLLHHDFPDYLVENHMQLNASIPGQCLQLQNIVNSAAPRNVFNEQPDPFTPGLKVNRLEHVRDVPSVHSADGNVLEQAGIKAAMQQVCEGQSITEHNVATILAAADREDGQVSFILLNAIVLHIGVHATSASSVFSAGTPQGRLLVRLVQESQDGARYHLISAIANQVRYVNAHTHYFSGALHHIFGVGPAEIQEQIMRALCERLMVPRPHPWGLIVMMLELIKNNDYALFELPWVQAAPQVHAMLLNLASSQDQRLNRSSPLGGFN